MGRRGFTRQEILEIRRAHAWGHNNRELAQAYGISEKAVRDIVKCRTYGRVRDDAPETPPQPLPKGDATTGLVEQAKTTPDRSSSPIPRIERRRISPPKSG